MGTPIDTGQGGRVSAPAVQSADQPLPRHASATDDCPLEIPWRPVSLTEREYTAFLAATSSDSWPHGTPAERPSSEARAQRHPHALPISRVDDAE